MIKFFKDNSSLIVKLLVHQMGMMFFGLVLSMATASFPSLLLFASIFAVVFYLVLIYYVMWEQGAKDTIRIDSGRMQARPFFALKASAMASLPNFFGAFLLLLAFFGFTVCGFNWCYAFYTVVNIIVAFLQAMYLGIFSTVLDMFDSQTQEALHYGMGVLLYTLSSIPMILVSVGAYTLGRRNIRLFGFMQKQPTKGE